MVGVARRHSPDASASEAFAAYKAIFPYVNGCVFARQEGVNPAVSVGQIAVGGTTVSPIQGGDCAAYGIGTSLTALPYCPFGGVVDPYTQRCVPLVCTAGTVKRNNVCIPESQCVAAAGQPFLGNCEAGKDDFCSDTVGNPCNPATGNKTHREILYAGPSGLEVVLTYNSLDPGARGYGVGWRDGNERFVLPTPSEVRVYRPYGRSYSFAGSGSTGRRVLTSWIGWSMCVTVGTCACYCAGRMARMTIKRSITPVDNSSASITGLARLRNLSTAMRAVHPACTYWTLQAVRPQLTYHGEC